MTPRRPINEEMRGARALVLLSVLSSCGPPPRPPVPLSEPAPPTAASTRPPAPRTGPTSSARPEPEPEPPPPDTDWGTPHPVLLAAADPGRRWIAVCQARRDTNGDGRTAVRFGIQGEHEGDAFDGYLLTGPGKEERIDAFVDHSPSGRWVAFVVDGALILLDATTGLRTNLSKTGADIRDDQSNFARHRAGAFDQAGKRFLYLRSDATSSVIVVRTLETGKEHEISVEGGLLWRAAFDATGNRVVAQIVTDDTSKNGRLEWPKKQRRGQAMRCPAPVPRMAVWDHPGDRARPGTALITADRLAPSPHLVLSMDAADVERHPDGTLLLRMPDGTTRLLARDRCEARIVHADPTRNVVLLTCREKKTGRHQLSIRAPGFVKDLELRMITTGEDTWIEGAPRLVPIHAGKDAALLDAKRRTVALLEPGDRIAATSDQAALVVRGNHLILRDVSGTETDLGVEMDPFGKVLRSGDAVAALPWVVRLDQRKLVGAFDAEPLAISSDGFGLFAAEPGGGAVPTGPLRWRAPTAPQAPVPSSGS